MKKKYIKVLIMVATILVADFMTLPIHNVLAKGNSNQSRIEFNEQNIFSEGKKQRNISKKINDELSNDTGLINKEMEDYLNNNGIFDEEIPDIGNKCQLDKININDLVVYTGYYAVSDTEDKADVDVDDDAKLLNENETNALLGNLYYNENNEITNNEEKQSIVDNLLEVVGIKPINVYADFVSKGGGDETYLKKNILVYSLKINNKDCVRICYTVEWTTMPKYRNIDIVTLNWTNAKYQNYLEDYLSIEQKCKWKSYYSIDRDKVTINNKSGEITPIFFDYYANPQNLRKEQYFVSSYGLCAAMKLHNDNNDKISATQTSRYTQELYYDEKLIIDIYLEIENGERDMTIYPYYLHYKDSRSVKSVAMGISNFAYELCAGNAISAIYTLASSITTTTVSSYSGVEFSYIYKFK